MVSVCDVQREVEDRELAAQRGVFAIPDGLALSSLTWPELTMVPT